MPRPLLLLTSFLSSSLAYTRPTFWGTRRPAFIAARGGMKGGNNLPVCFASTTAAPPDASASVDNQYKELCGELKTITALEGLLGLLSWDEQVMMPPGGAEARGKMKAALAGVLHDKMTNAGLGELLGQLGSSEALSKLPSDFDRANIRLATRDWKLETRKTKEMATRSAELEAMGYQAWMEARKTSDFAKFAPVLTEVIQLKKDIAKATQPDKVAYDANIDLFEVGMSSERLSAIFTDLKGHLVPLLKEVIASGATSKEVHPALQGGDQWKVESQVELCKEISSALGFDYKRGRMDVSPHPFTSGITPTDVRITTRYSTTNWLEGVAGTIHEVGHALYEQGRPADTYNDLPVSKALSMGVHESQSLFWERMVFQSRPFMDFVTPLFHKYFPHTKDCTADDFYRVVNRVRPGLIRVEADEVTYSLHIILRFELEKALFEGSIKVEDLPSMWNQKMKELLGVDVPSDAQGVLQDVHWPVGAIGYFPSYSLGAMMAAQLYEQAKKERPQVEEEIARGEFTPLRQWLNDKVHKQGSRYESLDALLVAITGKPLDPAIFVDYLRNKYQHIK